MVASKSKGSTHLNKAAMKAWEKRVEEAERKQQERPQRSSSRVSNAGSAS